MTYSPQITPILLTSLVHRHVTSSKTTNHTALTNFKISALNHQTLLTKPLTKAVTTPCLLTELLLGSPKMKHLDLNPLVGVQMSRDHVSVLFTVTLEFLSTTNTPTITPFLRPMLPQLWLESKYLSSLRPI